jgi:vacuolar-type H+-ATPase subunit B/Vma2
VGEEALSSRDKLYLKFANEFERRFPESELNEFIEFHPKYRTGRGS